MKEGWFVVNFGLTIFSAIGGYSSLSPERLRQTNPDLILCLVILGIMPLFTLGSIYYSIARRKNETLRRPSLKRSPLNWWDDPLQSLFLSTVCAAALFIGSVLRLPSVGSKGFWTSAMYGAMMVGLFLGQALAYRVFRSRIIGAQQ